MVEPISEIVDYMPKRTSPLTSATPQDHRDKKGENAPSSQEARSFQKLGSQEFEELSRSLDKRKLSYRFFKRVFDISFSIFSSYYMRPSFANYRLSSCCDRRANKSFSNLCSRTRREIWAPYENI